MTDIAGLIERLRKFLTMEDHPGDVALLEAIEEAADAIGALAKENARLQARCDEINEEGRTVLKATVNSYRQRIRELEAERDQYKDDYFRRHKDVGDQMELRIKAETERDAIWTKTIEECAQVAKLFEDAHDAEIKSSQNPTAMLVQGRQSQVARDIAAAIRALAQTDEGKAESAE